MRVLDNGVLQHVYYGEKIPKEDLSYYQFFQERAFSPCIQVEGTYASMDTIPQEYTTFGRGDYRQPSLVIEGSEGRQINELTFVSSEIIAGKPKLPGLPQLDVDIEQVETLVITMRDVITGAVILLHYSVFAKEDVIARHTVICNISEMPMQIRKAASLSLDLERADLDMISLKGSWTRERHISRRSIGQGTTSVESRRGSSSHQLNPFVALCEKDAGEYQGEVYGISFIYSADFEISAEVDQFETTRVQAGINPETFSWKLFPGEEFVTPEALLTYSSDGLNTMSRNFHRVCRNHLGKCADRGVKHPIIMNSWEAMYFDLSEEKVMQFIRGCKGLGIDTFVMDDGWFGHRDSDQSSLGDWFVDTRKFRNGLRNIVDCCHKNDMKFGIWFEPEMISRDSVLFREHPDWCIHCDLAEPVESRHQLALDMSRKEVVDCIYDQMKKMIEEYDISYIKWDLNRNLTDIGSCGLSADCQKEFTHRYILGVYTLMERFNRDFPDVFFEGCSGGGGRFDFGILYYMPQIWTSDDTDAVERMKIQYGTSYVYPPSAMVAHISACPNHQTGRTTPFDTRGEVAQMCNYGYELNVGLLSKEEQQKIVAQIEKHKRLKSLIRDGEFYRLKDPFQGNVCAWQLVSENQEQAYVFVGYREVEPHAKAEYLKLKGLSPEKIYVVEQLGITVSGATLMRAGIPIQVPWKEYEVLVFDIQEK